jgi:hypothetical protein
LPTSAAEKLFIEENKIHSALLVDIGEVFVDGQQLGFCSTFLYKEGGE